MKFGRSVLAILFVLFILCGFFNFSAEASSGNEERLSVMGGEPLIYTCDNGDRVVVRYYTLSDDSLSFVKVLLPDGREFTLPQVLSASGARYTDDAELVWWIKGDEAHVEIRNEDGDWQPLYTECLVIP